MVRQHDAAGTDADLFRARGDMLDDEGGGGAGDAAHAVMLGEPEALVAMGFRLLRKAAGIGERLGDGAAFDDRGQVENGKGHHERGLV